jgi:hypothetical protein
VPSPPPWPDRPSYAQDFDLFWLCAYHLPPDPWPDDLPPEDWERLWGPPGTVWTYSVNQLIDRLTVRGTGAGATALVNRYLSRLKGLKLPPWHTLSWTNPGPGHVFNEEYSVRWIRATIHGKYGLTEEVAHTFTLRTQPAPDVAQTVLNMQTLANQLRDQWVLFLDSTAPGLGSGTKVREWLSADLKYDEVRCSYLEQTAPGINPKGVKDPTKRPATLVPTQYSTFAGVTGNGTSSSAPLPYEVAAVMTLNTNVRGPSYRGRTYLGGLPVSIMDAGGLFNLNVIGGIAKKFGDTFIAPINANTGAQFQVVSRTHLVASPIQGVRCGVVPDSQRRRRRSLHENYFQAWGTPIGGALPA